MSLETVTEAQPLLFHSSWHPSRVHSRTTQSCGVAESFPEGVAAANVVCRRCTRMADGGLGVYPQVPALVCNRAGAYTSECVRTYPVIGILYSISSENIHHRYYRYRYLGTNYKLQTGTRKPVRKYPRGTCLSRWVSKIIGGAEALEGYTAV